MIIAPPGSHPNFLYLVSILQKGDGMMSVQKKEQIDSIFWIFYFCCIYIALDKVIWCNKISKKRIMNLQPTDRRNDGLLEFKKYLFFSSISCKNLRYSVVFFRINVIACFLNSWGTFCPPPTKLVLIYSPMVTTRNWVWRFSLADHTKVFSGHRLSSMENYYSCHISSTQFIRNTELSKVEVIYSIYSTL